MASPARSMTSSTKRNCPCTKTSRTITLLRGKRGQSYRREEFSRSSHSPSSAYYTGLGYEKVFLGKGKGISKNAAGQAAAKDALSSKLLEEIKMKRQKFLDEKVERERQDVQVKEHEDAKDEKKCE